MASVLSCFNCVQLCVTLWTVAHQGSSVDGIFRQEYRSWLPCPPPGDLPYTGIEALSRTSPALAGGFFATSTTWAAQKVDWGEANGWQESGDHL